METKVVKSMLPGAGNRSRNTSMVDTPDEGNGFLRNWQRHSERKDERHASFRQSFPSFRKSTRKSKNRDEREEQGPAEKKDILQKFRSSFIAKNRSGINNSSNKCDNESGNELSKEETSGGRLLLSVMEINELINEKDLQRAFTSIKVMEEHLTEEYKNGIYKSNTAEYTRRAKDIDMLYGSLFKQIKATVKDSLVQSHVDERLVKSVVNIIDEDAAANKNLPIADAKLETPPPRSPRRWKTLWKEVIRESVTERIGLAPMTPTVNASWLVEHLEFLKTNIVWDLLRVKNSLKPLYPEDYDVFGMYAGSFHDALSSHLKCNVLPRSLKFSQLYALLNWILNTYTSDTFMAHPDLQPDLKSASLSLLDDESLRKLKEDYVTALRETINNYLTKILENEKQNWETKEEPEEEVLQNSCLCPIYIDIEEMTGKHVRESTNLSKDLETPTFHTCMEELATFAARFQSEFTASFQEPFGGFFVQYFVIYVNSFIKLSNNPKQSDAEPCRTAETSLSDAVSTLKEHFFRLFTTATLPHFKKLLTKAWLAKNTAFKAIIKLTNDGCQYLKYLIAPLDKDLANKVYKHLVQQYIIQIMKRKMRLRNLNRKKAAQCMSQECKELKLTATELGSDLEHLFPAIHYISELIRLRKKDGIQLQLEILYKKYPDLGEEHVYSILYLQGMGRRKRSLLMNYFRELEKKEPRPSSDGPLFADIECSTRTTCF
ncbi:exocyst complex component 3-like protein 4 [Spea bombifrons]|uniref:exocyst complex component 3-like protein 4 n=1 Tax=Spea bombifrons TaxID=233779 RepID=UPI00234BD0DD|nr:exocyst complex component 3-like protein 4 [Spea bombifrons]